MFTSFNELLMNRGKITMKNSLDTLGQDLNRDIVAEMKETEEKGEMTPEYRKELNKQRISALNLKLIQGGKV